ncbi:hypothetical protein MPSEU_000776700 [Mayamaea pseudoterrestris]|nr:hypothetical protein MPSEU_000776700 [Mayamaea pseudoterrestris]
MNRIAFGSCNNQDLTNKLWPVITSRSPTAFIWGGDAIYADEHKPIDWSTYPPKSTTTCASPQRIRSLYRFQKSVPGYKRLLETNITVFGTFDDHDFGCNNGDSTYKYRHESGLAFVDFLGEPAQSPMRRRTQEGLGVYGVKLFDFDRPVGYQEIPDEEACLDPDACPMNAPYMPAYSNKTVAIFVLDVRTNKSPWKKGSAAFRSDFEGDFLGEEQWQWFEKAISRSQATVNVVVNGLQVHASRFPNAHIAESWDKFPRSRSRLFDAILQENVQSPILISGDVHMSQLMRKDCVKVDSNDAPRPLLELTTSGMTHSWGSMTSPPLFAATQSASMVARFEHFAAKTLMSTMHATCPWTELLESQTEDVAKGLFVNGGAEASKQGLQFSLEKNFGELEFDWDQQSVSIRSIGEDGKSLLSARLSLAQLSGKETIYGASVDSSDFHLAKESLLHALPNSEWVCVNYRGAASPVDHMIGQTQSAALTATIVASRALLLGAMMFLLCRRYFKTSCMYQRHSFRM